MALNIKGKKTTLDEEACIYEKRDENESEKSKWSRMDKSEKITHFKTYYLRNVIIGILVVALVGFFVYKDVIMKKDIIYRCAILNESVMDAPVTEFGDEFVTFLNLDTKKNLSSFHLFYTDNELATQVGASVSSDLTQISSMVYASTLDSMIAGQKDYDSYMDHEFFVDLTEILSEEERNILKEYLYVPDTDKNPQKHPFGVYLDQSSVYNKIFESGGGLVEKPIFGIVFNSENKEISKQFLYYVFPELQKATKK